MSLRAYLLERIAALRKENIKLSERIESGRTWFPDLVENRITSKGERITELEQILAKLDEAIEKIESLPARETIMGDKQVFVVVVLEILRGTKTAAEETITAIDYHQQRDAQSREESS